MTPPAAAMTLEGMRRLAGGSFLMGSEDFYPEEGPIRRVEVEAFWIDTHPVTVAQFRRFVKATGYVTVAERPLDRREYPDADAAALVPGSLVFQPSRGPVDLRDFHNWWAYVPGATWQRPEGPASDTYTRARHPVTQVAYEDAEAYAAWAGKALPTESEWEYAARGGLEGAVFAWGDEFAPGGRMMANTWQGEFPWENLGTDGYEGTSPVGAFPPNGYGLSDMAGNVWEWTSDYYTARHADDAARPCCAPHNPRVTAGDESYDPQLPDVRIRRRVMKGGSHLCAPNYCLRYRPAARMAQPVDTSTCHLGFRLIVRVPLDPS